MLDRAVSVLKKAALRYVLQMGDDPKRLKEYEIVAGAAQLLEAAIGHEYNHSPEIEQEINNLIGEMQWQL